MDPAVLAGACARPPAALRHDRATRCVPRGAAGRHRRRLPRRTGPDLPGSAHEGQRAVTRAAEPIAGTEQVRLVVVDWRLPRALLAALFGAALGLSGAIFQSLTRNALGSPDVIGFNMGSYTGVLVVMLAGGSGFLLIASGAVVGGLITAFLVYLLAYKRGVQGFRLIIIGIALSAMLGSLNTWIIVKADVAFAMQAAVWGAAPQLARRLTSAGSSIDLVTSALVGAALLSIADLIAQHALPGVSLPVGAVTVSIGGLYLVWLLARETKTR
ncbi:FecCD family ABC transporter permease [Pseudoclavibacter helvolus]